MRRTYTNFWSGMAAEMTAIAHTSAPIFRWGVLLILVVVWVGAGAIAWGDRGVLEAIYRTISAVGMYDDYFDANDDMIQLARFAGIIVPVVGILFAFSGALGRSLAHMFNLGAANHVVIAGVSPPALTLALDCRLKGDAVILIGEGLSEETALSLRRRGVIVIEGDPTRSDALASARAHHAAHVVAFEPDDTANLQIEAAVRRLVGSAKRRPPIGVHVATASPMLLKEAREMRSQQMRGKSARDLSIDPKPFSLDEIAARALIQSQAQTMLDLADHLGQERVHILFFGFDDAAEAVATHLFKSLWSLRFGAPRITVLTPDHEAAEARFQARHCEAFAHPGLWSADIVFMPFNWDAQSIGHATFEMIEHARGKPTAAVVSTGTDPGNIHLAIALGRSCNHGLRWPIPIFMKESARSEFSQTYAKGDETEQVDAYLQAFGARQETATRAIILRGALDRGAAIAHEHYNKAIAKRDPMRLKDLQAALRDWPDVLETYRSANRAAADSALVKMWDAGWRLAHARERGDVDPVISQADIQALAKVEHDRWCAERLMAGWRPSGERDNDLMLHDNLVPWEDLDDELRARDAVQVRAAIDIARVTHPHGFVRRPAPVQSPPPAESASA